MENKSQVIMWKIVEELEQFCDDRGIMGVIVSVEREKDYTHDNYRIELKGHKAIFQGDLE